MRLHKLTLRVKDSAHTLIFRYNWSAPDLAQIYHFKENDTHEFLREAAHRLTDSFLFCILFEETRNCSTLLKSVTTDAGQ